MARREHSALELAQKLALKQYQADDISHAIQALIKHGYQSDARFAREFVQMRVNQGKGSVKIAFELKQRGIKHFDLSQFDFFELAKQVRIKKYGKQIPNSYQQKSKQQRFLQSRGFDFEQINHAFEI